jgi:hypothetical protein
VNGQFSICITRALLLNDNVAGAINLEMDKPCPEAIYTNVGATQTNGEPTGSCSSTTGYATVWYKFIAPAGGAVRVSTAMGTGNTLTNTRVALYGAGDLSNYQSFQIISCDEDGGSGVFDKMSVLYATGLTEGWTYYIEVDKFDNLTPSGTFCLTVETLKPDMLSTTNACNSNYQVPVGAVPDYLGWVSLMDADSKLIALVGNTSGGAANAYTIKQNIKDGDVRRDAISDEYYLNRSFKITNTAIGNSPILVQLFYLNTELEALRAVDPAAATNRLRVTGQTGTECQPDFIAASGSNTELFPTAFGSQNGVNWIRFNATEGSNFYLHSIRSKLKMKTFLQGAYNSVLGRHKDVTVLWANVLNTYARSQPYNTPTFGNYSGTESVPQGFFRSTPADTDIVDWVLIETKSTAGSVLSRRAAFIREDGQIVDLDGVSPVAMYGQFGGACHIIIRHRNHLAIRTSLQQSFISEALGTNPSSILQYDFTSAQSKAYQNAAIINNAAMKDFGGGKFGLWAGNSNGNNTIRASGIAPTLNDFLYLVNIVLGGNVAIIIPSAYNSADINMDGIIRASGLNANQNDFLYLVNMVLNGNAAIVYSEHQ